MENQFLIDSEDLSPEALEIKHRLETDPSSRKSHMEYLPGMEVIESDIRSKVMEHMNSYDYSSYTGRDVMAALATRYQLVFKGRHDVSACVTAVVVAVHVLHDLAADVRFNNLHARKVFHMAFPLTMDLSPDGA